MDFKIPGLPHSTVKHAHSTSVRELIQKIENHPNRHALQRDLQQSQSFNPFIQESKQMIQEVGNIELCELLDMESNTQCIKNQTNLSEEIRVEQTHDRSGQPYKHELALRAAPEVHREITTLNTDNELTRERIEEDTDFKIPGLPHSILL